MKITLVTIGSRGDVQPYINLCRGLRDAGHDAVLATNPSLMPLAESYGLTCVAVGPPVDMGLEAERLMDASFGNMYLGMIRVMGLASRLIEDAYPDVLAAIAGSDLVITSDTGSGAAEAEKLGLPWIGATLQPLRIPVDKPEMSRASKAIWGLLGRLMILPVNRMRKRLGAPLVSDIGGMLSSRMILLPVSPSVAKPDERWPARVAQTGYWYAKAEKDWMPPADLVDFIRNGSTPIAISLGIMSAAGRRARESAGILLATIKLLGIRAVVQGWDKELAGSRPPEGVYFAGSLPHEWLFEKVAAVVHHGGFGTTAATFRAGIPAVVVPHVIDQFYWGQRVFELGTGPKFIPRRRLGIENLGNAISTSLNDAEMRSRAAALGESIRAEPEGVGAAVRAIEEAFSL